MEGTRGSWRPRVLRPNLRDNYRRAITFVDRIFKGTVPADLPLEQLTKYELVS